MAGSSQQNKSQHCHPLQEGPFLIDVDHGASEASLQREGQRLRWVVAMASPEALCALRRAGEHTDIQLVTAEGSAHAHQVILAAASTSWKDFLAPLQGNEAVVQIDNVVQLEALEVALDLMYGLQVDPCGRGRISLHDVATLGEAFDCKAISAWVAETTEVLACDELLGHDLVQLLKALHTSRMSANWAHPN